MAMNGTPRAGQSLIDTSIFSNLQTKIDEETAIREELKAIVETLSKQARLTQSIISRIHNVPSQSLNAEVLEPCMAALEEQRKTISTLKEAASKYPFYKYNGMWQRDIQNLISNLQLWQWLQSGKLVSLEEVGQYFQGMSSIPLLSLC